MRRIYFGLVVLCAVQIPIALFAFLVFFKSIPQIADGGGALDLRIMAHLVWPVACLMGPLLARFPARHDKLAWVVILGTTPLVYGVALTLSGL